jgi:hypothetical protein
VSYPASRSIDSSRSRSEPSSDIVAPFVRRAKEGIPVAGADGLEELPDHRVGELIRLGHTATLCRTRKNERPAKRAARG